MDDNKINLEIEKHKKRDLWQEGNYKINEANKWIQSVSNDTAKQQKTVSKLQNEIVSLEEHKCYACGQELHDNKQDEILTSKKASLEEANVQIQLNENQTYLVSKYFDRKIDKENNLMREKVSLFRKNKKMEVEYIDLISHFCRSGASNDEDYKCNVWTTPERNDLIIFDYGHLTQQGSKYAVKLLLDDN